MYKCELEFLHSKDRNSSLWCVDAFIQLVNTFFYSPCETSRGDEEKESTATFTERLGMRVLPEYDWLVYGCPPLSGVRMPLPVQSSKSIWQTETIHTAPHTTTRKHFYSLKEGFPSAAHTEKDEEQWTLWGVFEDLKHGTLNPSLHMDCTWRQQLG